MKKETKVVKKAAKPVAKKPVVTKKEVAKVKETKTALKTVTKTLAKATSGDKFRKTGSTIVITFNDVIHNIETKDKKVVEALQSAFQKVYESKTKANETKLTALIVKHSGKSEAMKEKYKEVNEIKKEVKKEKVKTRLIDELKERLSSSDVSQEEIDELKALMSKAEKVVAPTSQTSNRPSRGEY